MQLGFYIFKSYLRMWVTYVKKLDEEPDNYLNMIELIDAAFFTSKKVVNQTGTFIDPSREHNQT